MKIKSIALTAVVVMAGLAVIDDSVAAEPTQNFVTPGPNKNIIGQTPNPNTLRIPDLFRKQQNEPSCIQTTDNPADIMCGFNDCRASDWPEVQGDCWIGTAQSRDFGETWTSRLAPGYLGHPYSLGMGFAADAALAEIPGNSPGLMLLTYIAAHRDSDAGVIAVQRYAKSPREDGEPFLPVDAPATIAATGAEGRFHDKVASIFIVNQDNPQSSTSETMSLEGVPNPVTINRLNGVHIIAYSVFTGNGSAVKVLTKYSIDGGVTYSTAKKVSDELNTVTGVHLAYLPGVGVSLTYRRSEDSNDFNGVVQVLSTNLARRWSKTQTLFDICPSDQHASGIAARIFSFPWGADGLNRLWVFSADKVDPDTGERIFAQGNCTQVPGAPAGVYPGVSRIVGMSSLDGENWYGSVETPDEPFILHQNGGIGHQVFPFAQGTRNGVDIAWWDTSEGDAIRPLPPGATSPNTGSDLPYIYDYLTGGARVFRTANIYMTRITGCIAEMGGACTPEQPIDNGLLSPVRVSRYQTAVIDGVLQEVEANPLNLTTHGSGKLAYTGDYGAFGTQRFRRLPTGRAIQNSLPQQPDETNFVANQNTFLAWGENRDVFFGNIPDLTDPNRSFLYSPPVNAAPVLQAPGYQAKTDDSTDSDETPLGNAAGEEAVLKAVSEPDDEPGAGSTADTVVCLASQNFSRSRDSGVYSTVVEDKPSLIALTQARPMNLTQRMIPLVLSNPDSTKPGANMCLVLANQPPDYLNGTGSGRASFDPLPARNDPDLFVAPRERLDVLVPALGTASRSAFITSSFLTTRIIVNAYQGACPQPQNPEDPPPPLDPSDLISSVQIGHGALFDPLFCQENPANPGCLPVEDNETHNLSLVSPGLQAPGFQAPGYQAPVYQAPVLQADGEEAPVLQAPVLQAPGMQAPGFQAEGEEAPVLQAPSYQAPSLQAETLESNTLASPGMQAPSLQAPSLQAALLEDTDPSDGYDIWYQDLTYLVSINANVTTTASADIAVVGLNPDETSVELIAWQPNVHTTTAIDPVSGDCIALPEADNKIIASVDLGSPGLQASSLGDVSTPFAFGPGNQEPYNGEVSFYGKPGDEIALTARFWVTGTAKATLDRLYECSTSANPPADCLPQEIEKGAFLLVPFGAGAHGCSRNVNDPENPPDVDCISEGVEKIVPPDLFAPEFFPENGGGVAHEADSQDGSAQVNTPGTVPDGISVTDADPLVTVSCKSDDVVLNDGPMATTLFQFGDSVVTCTATDTALNQSIAGITISIVDLMPPTISVPAPFPPVEAESSAGAMVIFTSDDVSADDNTTTEIVCTPSSGSTFALGTTNVSCTATDLGGNTAIGMFDVIVFDNGDPQITVPEPITEEATDSNGAAVSFSVTAADDIDTDVTTQCTIISGATEVEVVSGDTFPLGSTSVTCTATDDAENAASASFDIIVEDTTAPVVDTHDDITVDPDDVSGAVVDFVVTASDAVDLSPVVSCSPASGSPFPIGTTSVTCSATDASGNPSADSSFNVKVEVGMSGLSLKRSVKAGSANPVSWAWTNADDIPVNIGSGIQKIEARAGICSSNSDDVLDEDPGSSGYHQSSDYSWQYNWQTDDADGDMLTAGPYCVRVTLLTTMQYMEANTTIR